VDRLWHKQQNPDPFGDRAARMMMAVARDPRITNRTHVSVLPPSCRAVGIENPRNVSARLADDQKDAVQIMDAIGRKQDTTIVNEAGLPLLRSGLLN
jgi:hypothetical protein